MAEPTKLTPLTPDEVRSRAYQFLTARKVAIQGGPDLLTGTIQWSQSSGCLRSLILIGVTWAVAAVITVMTLGVGAIFVWPAAGILTLILIVKSGSVMTGADTISVQISRVEGGTMVAAAGGGKSGPAVARDFLASLPGMGGVSKSNVGTGYQPQAAAAPGATAFAVQPPAPAVQYQAPQYAAPSPASAEADPFFVGQPTTPQMTPAPAPAAPQPATQPAAPAAPPATWSASPAPAGCSHCGYTKTPPGKTSCFNCGRKLDGATGSAQPSPTPATGGAQPSPTPATGGAISAAAGAPLSTAVSTCSHCGYTKTPPGKTSCFNCGRKLDGANAAMAPAQQSQTAAFAPAMSSAPSTSSVPMPPPPPAPPAWTPTHWVPSGGMAAWNAPDSSQPPACSLSGGLDLVVDTTTGAWSQVRAANGWRGWVDGRLLSMTPTL